MRRRHVDQEQLRERIEMNVLATLLLAPQRLVEAADVNANDFFYPWNRIIWEYTWITAREREWPEHSTAFLHAVVRAIEGGGDLEMLTCRGGREFFVELLAVEPLSQFPTLLKHLKRCPWCER